MKKALPFLFGVLLALSPFLPEKESGAQPKTEQIMRMDIYELMDVDVVTPSKVREKVFSAPADIIVITGKEIEERGYRNLRELLEDLPSVDVHRNTSEDLFERVHFRGFGDRNQFKILQDGRQINSPTGESIPLDENFPLFNAKQVEVVLGPASALYGADAHTGIVNIISRDAVEISGVHVSSSFGQYNDFYDSLNFGEKLARNIDLSFGGHWHHADNPDLSSFYPSEYPKADLITSGGTLIRSAADREDFYFGTGSYSSYANLNIDDRFHIGFSQSFFRHPTTAGVQPDKSIFGRDVKWETLLRNYFGEYNFRITDNLSGKSTLSYLTYEVPQKSKFKNIFVDFQDGFKYARSDRFKLGQEVNYRISEKHHILGGISWENFHALPKTFDLPKPFEPDLPAASQGLVYPNTNGSIPISIFELHYTDISLYLQNQSRWTDILSTTLGVRFDRDSRYGNTVNPRAALILSPLEGTTLKVLYGESFMSPSPFWAYQHFGSFNGTTNDQGEYISDFMQIPNPDLKPVKARTPEIFLAHAFSSHLLGKLSAFYSWSINRFAPVTHTTPSSFIPGGELRTWRRYENIGDAQIFGGYLDLSYHRQWGRSDWKIWGNYSYTDGWEEENGVKRELGATAKNKIKGGVTFWWNGKYVITPTVRWIGASTHPSRLETGSTTRLVKADAYTIVNLHAGIRDVIQNLSLSLDIQNLLDKRYRSPGGSSANFVTTPQDPIRVRGTLEYRFDLL